MCSSDLPDRALAYADALGLAFFSLAGAQIAETGGLKPFAATIMGALTGCAGGLIRDVLVAEVPLIFRQSELYVTAVIAGVALYFGLAATLHPVFTKNGAIDASKEFTPISDTMTAPYALFTSAKLPVTSFKELSAYAKTLPAGKLNFGKSVAQQELVVQETQQSEDAPVRVDVIEVNRGSAKSELELPGNIQASTEAPILARADGYIKRRMVDIGDRVRAGQPLAEIEAPEVDQQIRQARAALQQAQAAQEQSTANLAQGKATMELARVTADRWSALAAQGVVSKQENDQYQAQYQAQTANVQALEKAIAAQRSNVAAAEANLARLDEVQSYRVVKAPFDGVITLRNVDVGALEIGRAHV